MGHIFAPMQHNRGAPTRLLTSNESSCLSTPSEGKKAERLNEQTIKCLDFELTFISRFAVLMRSRVAHLSIRNDTVGP